MAEAALDILVLEVEPLVASYRREHDPSAAQGMPAHITINYPFLPGVDPRGGLYQELAELFAGVEPFDFALRDFGRFPNVLYFAPEPAAPFKRLIDMVSAWYPDSPPYGGAFEEVTPHLTIAHSEDIGVLESIEHKLKSQTEQLPLQLHADRVWLLDNRSGRWQKQKPFFLGKRRSFGDAERGNYL